MSHYDNYMILETVDFLFNKKSYHIFMYTILKNKSASHQTYSF